MSTSDSRSRKPSFPYSFFHCRHCIILSIWPRLLSFRFSKVFCIENVTRDSVLPWHISVISRFAGFKFVCLTWFAVYGRATRKHDLTLFALGFESDCLLANGVEDRRASQPKFYSYSSDCWWHLLHTSSESQLYSGSVPRCQSDSMHTNKHTINSQSTY